MQNLCYFLEKISFVKIYSLCREIHFVAIYALLCGEKFIQKFSLWRKNDKYEVCSSAMAMAINIYRTCCVLVFIVFPICSDLNYYLSQNGFRIQNVQNNRNVKLTFFKMCGVFVVYHHLKFCLNLIGLQTLSCFS